jgi:hypothetical protein
LPGANWGTCRRHGGLRATDAVARALHDGFSELWGEVRGTCHASSVDLLRRKRPPRGERSG